jgi:paraquat-inducible protein B
MKNQQKNPQAQVEPLKSISKIWLIPIVALFIGAWMIYFHLSSQGPLIVIYFASGEGIEAGKTKIKVKNVEVGLVEKLKLNDDLNGIAVTARVHKNDEYLLMEDTEFWVVRPRIGKSGVSGLGTLLSGAYIELAPGTSDKAKFEFIGLENIPVTPAGTPGLHVTLDSSSEHALHIGDPIIFHGVDVGQIEWVHFNTSERTVYYNAFIESPYDKLVTSNTRFWEVNGIEVNLSADGIRMQTGTLETLISGGVTFDVPEDMPRGEVITTREFFTIYPHKGAIYENRYKYALHYMLLFKDSIRGLRPGAPVEYRGIKVGAVARTDIDYPEISNILEKESLIPVMINIEPARVGFKDKESALPLVEKDVAELLKKGLRGGLATGSLLTGSKYVELQYDEGVLTELETFNEYLVIPTLESQFAQIIKKVNAVMNKIYELPVEPVISSAEEALQEITTTVKEFKTTAMQLEILLKQSSDENLVGNIKDVLENFKKLAADFSEGSMTHEELQSTLRRMKDALAELEPFLSQLNQKPNSLIFNNEKDKDIEPKGIKQ